MASGILIQAGFHCILFFLLHYIQIFEIIRFFTFSLSTANKILHWYSITQNLLDTKHILFFISQYITSSTCKYSLQKVTYKKKKKILPRQNKESIVSFEIILKKYVTKIICNKFMEMKNKYLNILCQQLIIPKSTSGELSFAL